MEDKVKMHWLPCTISHTGPANVGAYFMPKLTGHHTDGYAIEEAQFRGRQLKGTTLQLPDGYTGQVLVRQDAESNWVPQTLFTEFTYWKHGVDPLRKDSAQRCLDYLKVCQQMHAPVSEECLSMELADNSFEPAQATK
ncbi:g8491 [Coccomyxa viridis]|uniref:G8491 protein n=1 Tax=Coccomyxa viridis TaxID=1274662 RepID=A0ABP1G0H4_9CHLO